MAYHYPYSYSSYSTGNSSCRSSNTPYNQSGLSKIPPDGRVREWTDARGNRVLDDIPDNTFVLKFKTYQGEVVLVNDVFHRRTTVIQSNYGNQSNISEFHNQQPNGNNPSLNYSINSQQKTARPTVPKPHLTSNYGYSSQQKIHRPVSADSIIRQNMQVKIEICMLLTADDENNHLKVLRDLVYSQFSKAGSNGYISLFEVVAYLKFVGCQNIPESINKLGVNWNGDLIWALKNTEQLESLSSIESLDKMYGGETSSFIAELQEYHAFFGANQNQYAQSIIEISCQILPGSKRNAHPQVLFLRLALGIGKNIVNIIKMHSQLIKREANISEAVACIPQKYNSNCITSMSCWEAKHATVSLIFLDYVTNLGFNKTDGIYCDICLSYGKTQAVFDCKKGVVSREPKSQIFLHCFKHDTDVCSDCLEKFRYFHLQPSVPRNPSINARIRETLNNSVRLSALVTNDPINTNFCILLNNFYGREQASEQTVVYVCYQFLLYGELNVFRCRGLGLSGDEIQYLNSFIQQNSILALCLHTNCDELTKTLLFWLSEQAEGAKQLREKAHLDTFQTWLHLATSGQYSLTLDITGFISTYLIDALNSSGIINLFSQAKTELPFLCSNSEFSQLPTPPIQYDTEAGQKVQTEWVPVSYRLAFLYSKAVDNSTFKYYHPNAMKEFSSFTGIAFFCDDCKKDILWVDHLTGDVVENNTGGHNFIACNLQADVDICAECAGISPKLADSVYFYKGKSSTEEKAALKQADLDNFDEQNLTSPMLDLSINQKKTDHRTSSASDDYCSREYLSREQMLQEEQRRIVEEQKQAEIAAAKKLSEIQGTQLEVAAELMPHNEMQNNNSYDRGKHPVKEGKLDASTSSSEILSTGLDEDLSDFEKDELVKNYLKDKMKLSDDVIEGIVVENTCQICTHWYEKHSVLLNEPLKKYKVKSDKEKAALTCGHILCTNCLKEFMKKNYPCPVCRESSGDIIKLYT